MEQLNTKSSQELDNLLLQKQAELKKVNERLTNPLASDDTIHHLHRTKNELVGEIQQLESELAKRAETYPLKPTGKSFERSLNESETPNYGTH